MTTATGTGRDTGRHRGRERIAEMAAERAGHLGEEIRFFRSLGEPDGRIAARLRVAVESLGRYAGQAAPEDGEPGDGGYETAWEAGEGDRRAARVTGLAADFVRCHRAGDVKGVREVLYRVRDWHAFAVVLGECADLDRAAEVTGREWLRPAKDGAA